MRQQILARGHDAVTAPIRLGEGRQGLTGRPADPRWLAAVVLMACVAAGLMVIPLSALTERQVSVATVLASLDGTATTNAVVGVRGDPVGVRDDRPSSPSLFERQLEHMRLSNQTLRTYTYILAKPAFAKTESFQDASGAPDASGGGDAQGGGDAASDAQEASAAPDATTTARDAPAGLGKSRRAEPAGVPINITDIERTLSVANKKKVIVFQDGNTPAAILEATGMAAADAASASALLLAQAALRGRPFAAGDLVELTSVHPDRRGIDSRRIDRRDPAIPIPDWQDPDHPNAEGEGTGGGMGEVAMGDGKPFRISIIRRGDVLGAVAIGDAGGYAPIVQAPSQAAAPAVAASLNDFSAVGTRGVSLREGLYALVDQGKLARPLVDDLIRICGRDVDVEKPASLEDTVSVLVSPETSDGRAQPEIAYASVTSGGREHGFYRFASDHDAAPDYFNEAGQSVSRFLLRKPVAAGRLGDGFGWRIHPVLKDRRFHEGVDYAAPSGSPIVAAGAGVVEKIDAQWGYGKYIRIKHDQGYETTYAHISGVPANMRIGARVVQGETIAYVGSTGLSTGPHLYYEVRINGSDVDPLRIKLAGGAILRGEALAAFELRKHRIDLLLKDARDGAGLQVAGETH